MVCGSETLSKTRQTARPYAPAAMAFLFTSIIKFTVLCTLSFSIRLLEKGSEGSACGISFKEKLSGRLSQSNGSDHRREIGMKNCDACVGYADPSQKSDPNPARTCPLRTSVTHAAEVISLTPAFVSIKSYINPYIQTLHMQLLHLNASCRITKQ